VKRLPTLTPNTKDPNRLPKIDGPINTPPPEAPIDRPIPRMPVDKVGPGTGIGWSAGVPAYKKGTNYVPSTGLAVLHKGEAVLKKEDADKYRAGTTMDHDGAMQGLGGDTKPPKHITHVSVRKAHGGHIIEHHHNHPHPMEEHTTHGTDGLVNHMMTHMTEPNPGEAEANAGQSGIPGAAGAGPSPDATPIPGV
jgi:hypothetical protein